MTVKFKDESETISFGNKRQPINSNNLTWENYTKLIEEFPQLKEKFIEITESPKSKKGE